MITQDEILKFRDSYFKAIASLSPKTSIITDKMPHNFRLVGLLAAAFPEAKFVHTHRDPAAVCWSNYYISFGSNGLGYSYGLETVVKFYHLYRNMMKFWKTQLGDRIYDLDYETLTQNQADETKKLIEHLEIGWDEACLFPEKNERKVLTASHSQVKKSVYTGSSQKWRKFEPFLDGAFSTLGK